MTGVTVSRARNYDDFRAECDGSWPRYFREASRILRTLTAADLKRNATMHPDGFLKLSIGPANWVRDGQVRLHFWIPDRGPSWQPHGHPWHLASMVLAGTYREHLPDLRPDDGGQLRKFEVVYPPGEDFRADVRRVGAETYENVPGPIYETRDGDAHYLPAGPVHMSLPGTSGGVTLAVMSPRFSNSSYFYAAQSMGEVGAIRPDELDAVMEMLADLRGNL